MIANVAFAKSNTLNVGALNPSSTRILLSSYFGVLEDSTGLLTLADVQKEDVSQRFQTDFSADKALNMSYTSSAYWLRLELENSSDKSIERVLDIQHPLIENVDFYFQTENEHYQAVHTGYSQPFESRPYQSRNFAFPMVLPAHSHHTVYLRVQTLNAMILHISLWQPNDFNIKERNEYATQALYFGLVMAIALLNLIFALVLKESDYLLYVCMIFFLAMTFFASRGFGSEFLWHDSTWLTRIAPLSFGSIAMVFQLFFVRQILDTRHLAPKVDDALKSLIGIQILIPVVLLLEFRFAKFVPIIFAISSTLVLIVSVIGMQKGKRNAYFLFVAFSVLAIGVIINTMLVLAVIPTNLFTIYSAQFGSALELIIFTFLLIDRYKIISDEKQENAIALQAITNENELLTHANNENELLNRQMNHMQKLESIGRLTSGIAHDFNNILMCILGYNEMNVYISEDITDDELKIELENNTKQIDLAGKRAGALIDKMLMYCRQENDDIKKRDVQPTQAVINEVLELLRPALTSKIKIEFLDSCHINQEDCNTCGIRNHCDIRIQIHSGDLHQILTNLAINARDSMREKGGIITISLKKVTEMNVHCDACAKIIEGDFIELSVSDNGTGIEPKIIHRLFDPFFTTKEQGEGTGLGLSAVSGLVHSSHGHVLIDSDLTKENHGTTFRLFFPQL